MGDIKAPYAKSIKKKEVSILECIINMTWDNEANVWIATSKEVPGLVLESGSFDALLERVRYAIPELLKLNASLEQPEIVRFVSERSERMVL